MQDNSVVHTGRHGRNWSKAINMEVLDPSAHSHDLNPIENISGVLVSAFYGIGRQFYPVDVLKSTGLENGSWILINIVPNLV